MKREKPTHKLKLTLAERILHARISRGLSRIQVARMLIVDPSSLHEYERDGRPRNSKSYRKAIEYFNLQGDAEIVDLTFQEWVHIKLRRCGIKKKELAEQIGVSFILLSKWLTYKRRIGNARREQIMEVLGE